MVTKKCRSITTISTAKGKLLFESPDGTEFRGGPIRKTLPTRATVAGRTDQGRKSGQEATFPLFQDGQKV